MSLIMDALEKIQREKQGPGRPAGEEVFAGLPEPVMAAAAPAGLSWMELQKDMPGDHDQAAGASPWLRGGILFATILAFGAMAFLFQQSARRLAAPETALSSALPAALLEGRTSFQGVLNGIVQDESGAFCLISGNILKKGDTWRGYQIVSIGLRQVTLKNRDDQFLTLKLQE